jgi:hypothetical protein
MRAMGRTLFFAKTNKRGIGQPIEQPLHSSQREITEKEERGQINLLE